MNGESSKDNYLILAETVDDDKTHTAETIFGDSFSMQIIQVTGSCTSLIR